MSESPMPPPIVLEPHGDFESHDGVLPEQSGCDPLALADAIEAALALVPEPDENDEGGIDGISVNLAELPGFEGYTHLEIARALESLVPEYLPLALGRPILFDATSHTSVRL